MEVPKVDLKDFVYKPDTFGTIRAIGIDKYPGEMQIVRELLQNADDCGSTTVRFAVSSEEIVVENDGAPFAKPEEVEQIGKSDFFRISHIGLGKTKEQMTGTFGIGFTSVFHISDAPRIVSNGWDFEIHINDVPFIKVVPFDKITSFHLPLRLVETEISKKIKAEPFSLKKLKRFEEQLPKEAYRDVFFLKNVKKIEAYKNGQRIFLVQKKNRQREHISEGFTCEWVTIRVTLIANGRKKIHEENWMVFSLSGLDIPQYLEDLGQELNQEVSIAIPLTPKNTRITKEFDPQKYAYYTLPVMPVDFNFRYNASKLYTTSGRSEFVTKEGLKREWNLWQMDNLAELLSLSILDLISKKVRPNIIYRFVPISSQANDSLQKRLFDVFREKVDAKKIPIFYTVGESWRKKDEVYTNWNGLHEVLPEGSGTHLIHPSLERYASVFQSYGIKGIGLEELVDYLEQKYGASTYDGEKHDDPKRIKKIFEYLSRRRIEPQLMDRLRKVCILLTEGGILRSYEFKVYFPTDEKMPLINKGDILHHLTYNTRASKRFLQKKMKIKKINLHHLILHSFLPRADSYSDREKFEFVWYLIKRQRDVRRKQDTVQELRENLQKIVLVENIQEPSGPIFFADAALKDVFGEKLNYLSSKYEARGKKERAKWRDFLKKIGVKEVPHSDRVIDTVQELESGGYTLENVKKAELLLHFLHAHWRKFYSKHVENLQKLRECQWMPTSKEILAFATGVYANRKLQRLVGEEQNFLGIRIPRNKRLTKVLGLLTDARLDDVIRFILKKGCQGQGKADKPVSFAVYSFLNRKANSLSSDHVRLLRENRTIWFRGSLWKPSKLLLRDHRNEFGPNGWLRGYIKNNKLSRLHGLCSVLGINTVANNPDDYLDWLVDAADELEGKALKKWQIRLILHVYSKLASVVNTISEELLAEPRQKSVMLTSETKLRFPSECYLLRKGEEIVYERILKSGISVPVVQAEDAEHEKLYLRLGANEIAYSLSARRADMNQASLDAFWTDRFRRMLPWLDGFEFSFRGDLSDSNLAFQQMKVYRVNKLVVAYSLKGKDGLHEGNPIVDVCCYERDKGSIYLDRQFKFENNEHLRLITLNLIKSLNPDVDKVGWTLAIPILLNYGQIMGISPFDRERQIHKDLSVRVPLKWEREEEVSKPVKPKETLETRNGPVPIQGHASEDLLTELDKARAEATKITSEELLDLNKVYREKKEISSVTSRSTITYSVEAKTIAAKNWKLKVIDGEKVYVEEGMKLPPVSAIRNLRRLTVKIVEAIGFNPETVNICVARPTTDGYNERGQLFFNATRVDSPCRWFGVVVRELAQNYSRKHYPHVKAMVHLIAKGLETINEILPEFTLYSQHLSRAR